MSRARTGDGSSERDRGAAVLEMAIVSLLLFTLVFGIISYGYMMSFRQALTQAAAEGARAGAVAPTADANTNALEAVNGALEGHGLDCPVGNPSCSPCGAIGMSCVVTGPSACPTNATRQCITVTLTYDYKDNPLLPAPIVDQMYPETLEFTSVAETN